MINLQYLRFYISAIIAILFSTSVSATEHEDKVPTNHVGTIAVPTGLSSEGTQKGIVKAAVARKWDILDKSDGKVIIQLVHRGYDSTLTFLYNENEIKLYSDSWTISKRGDKKKKKDPKGWIGNLKKDIPVFLNRELHE